ncbi:MAG TPA: hypothetical protein VGQ10_09225 [Vicinamibacterales bacterium]|nr:hypothetical protein [Vicinamibacterales bacterium]
MRQMLVVLAALAVSVGCGRSAVSENPASPVAAAAEAAQTAAPVAGTSSVPATPSYREVTIPAGTTLALDLTSAVGSDTSKVEDAVRATLRQGVTVGGREVLPAGTAVTGAVTSAERSGRVKGRARIALRFTSLQHGGSRYDIQTQPITRVAPATKAKDATKIGIGAGAGAAIGALLGGGSGAAKGAAVGGAGGTGVVLATRGKEVQLGSGTNLTTKLTAPLTVRVPA